MAKKKRPARPSSSSSTPPPSTASVPVTPPADPGFTSNASAAIKPSSPHSLAVAHQALPMDLASDGPPSHLSPRPVLGSSKSLPLIGVSAHHSVSLPPPAAMNPPPVLPTASPVGAPPSAPPPSSSAATDPVSKPRWSDLVQLKKQKLAKKGDSFRLASGQICVKIPNDVIQRNLHKWDDFILGQFQGNTPSPGAMHAIVNGIWSRRARNITVSKISDRAFLIKIPCPATRRKVLDQGLWFIEKQAMFVAKWQPGVLPELPELTSAPVWVDFKNVPLHFYSEEGLGYIAGLVGEPLYLHPQTANMSNLTVARVFTVIDPRIPLPEVVNVQFDSGQVQQIDVSCPWLPPVCAHCNEIGHTLKRCPTAPVTCVDCNSTNHDVVHCPRQQKPLAPSARNLAEVPPAQATPPPSAQPVLASPPLSGPLVVHTDKSAPMLTTVTTGDGQGKLPTSLVPLEQGSTSKSLRSRRKLPVYFSSSGPAHLPSETDIFSSETDSSYNYSDEDEFPPLSERSKKGEAYRDQKPITN